MDIKSQVEARRAQLVEEDKQASEARAAQTAKIRQLEEERRHGALDQIASDLSNGDVEVRRSGDELEIVPTLAPIDIDGVRHSQLKKLLKQEARKRWSPAENWQVIGGIVLGICLLFVGGIGIVPLVLALSRRSTLQHRYMQQVMQEYPDIFADVELR